MRLGFLIAAMLVFAACSSSELHDSLQPCSFDAGCPSGESCDIGQDCGPAGPDGGSSCGPVVGDQKCHLSCEDGGTCPADEQCTTVALAQRTDFSNQQQLCLPPAQ